MMKGLLNMQIKQSKFKIIKIIVVIIIFLLLGYTCFHIFLNKNLKDIYASKENGFEKNHLGDYCKNIDKMVLSYYDLEFFSFQTNVSIANNGGGDAIIIWVSPISDKKEYGVVIQNDTKNETRQIEVDEKLNALDPLEQKYIDEKKDNLRSIAEVAYKEWGLLKDVN